MQAGATDVTGSSLLTAVVPDLSHARPDEEAGRLAALGAKHGLEGLRRENRRAWDELWRGRIVLDGAERRWQAITDASVFYLLSSTHSASLASTSLFGLAYWPTYHYYHGHVMWDIETFTVPPLLMLAPCGPRPAGLSLSAPERGTSQRRPAWLARSDVSLGELSAARGGVDSWSPAVHRRSRQRRHRPGLRWVRQCHRRPGLCPPDRVARAPLRRRVHRVAGRLERSGATRSWGTVGPREVYELVDNNAYTNMSSALALEAAVDCAADDRRAHAGALEPDRQRSGHPAGSTTGAIINHEGARLSELQGGVPEGAAGLFPLGYQTDADAELATYRYAAVEQAPLYVGAPMLSALLPVYAARAGEPALAAQLLESGYGEFINEPFLEPDEYPRSRQDRPRASPMFANLSGFLTGLLYGFTGLRPSPGEPATWGAHTAALPQGWHAIEVERVWIRRRAYSLHARPGAVVTLAASE